MSTSVSSERQSGRLVGKRVLITGTGRGQGAGAQELFCRHGATVFGCDVISEAAEAAAEKLRSQGLTAHGATVNLADPDSAAAWVRESAEAMGGLDVLYNNAGAPKFAPFGDMTLEEWRFTIVNELDILFLVTSPAWRLLAAGGGSIINTASVSAVQASESIGSAAHAAAKGGVLSLTRQLAAEGAPHKIRVNAISPGFVETPGTAVVPPAVKQRMIEAHPLRCAGTPEDIAQCAVYLASDESSWVTGAEFRVDGGAAII